MRQVVVSRRVCAKFPFQGGFVHVRRRAVFLSKKLVIFKLVAIPGRPVVTEGLL